MAKTSIPDYYKILAEREHALKEKYKNHTYQNILDEFVKPDNTDYCNVQTEDIVYALGVPYDYSMGWEVPFLKQYSSGLNWTCTDTEVGLYFIFLINDNGEEEFVGIREQEWSGGDSTYSFCDEEHRSLIIKKLLEMIKPEENEHTAKHSFKLEDKIFN